MVLNNILVGLTGISVAGRCMEVGIPVIPSVGIGLAMAAGVGWLVERTLNDNKKRHRRKAQHQKRMQSAAKKHHVRRAATLEHRRLCGIPQEYTVKVKPIREVKGELGAVFNALSDAEKAEVLDGSYAKAAKKTVLLPFREEFGLL